MNWTDSPTCSVLRDGDAAAEAFGLATDTPNTLDGLAEKLGD